MQEALAHVDTELQLLEPVQVTSEEARGSGSGSSSSVSSSGTSKMAAAEAGRRDTVAGPFWLAEDFNRFRAGLLADAPVICCPAKALLTLAEVWRQFPLAVSGSREFEGVANASPHPLAGISVRKPDPIYDTHFIPKDMGPDDFEG